MIGNPDRRNLCANALGARRRSSIRSSALKRQFRSRTRTHRAQRRADPATRTSITPRGRTASEFLADGSDRRSRHPSRYATRTSPATASTSGDGGYVILPPSIRADGVAVPLGRHAARARFARRLAIALDHRRQRKLLGHARQGGAQEPEARSKHGRRRRSTPSARRSPARRPGIAMRAQSRRLQHLPDRVGQSRAAR